MRFSGTRGNNAVSQSMPGRFARNSLYSTVAGLCTALGGFICSIIVARLLGVENTGAIGLALWIVSLAASIIDLGAQATLSRFIPDLLARADNDAAQALTQTLWKPVAVASAFTIMGLCGYIYWLHVNGIQVQAGIEPSGWLIVGLLCILQATTGYVAGYFRGSQRFDRLARVTIISFVFQIISVFVGALAFGVTGALFGYGVGAAVTASLLFTIPRTGSKLSPELRRRVVRYAAYAWGGGIITTFVWSRLEVLFLQSYWGNTSVGLFFVCLSFANLATQGPMLMTGGLLPYFSENFGRGNNENVHKAFAAATRTLAFMVFPMCFGAAAIVPAVVPLIYGNAFADATDAAAIIVAVSALGTVGSVGASIVFSAERSDFGFYSGLLGGVLSVTAGLTIIPAFGLIGAAWSRALIQTLMVVIGFWFIQHRLHCPVPYRGLGRIIVAAALCALAARFTLHAVSGYTGLAAAIGVGAGVYLIAARVLRAVPPEDVVMLERLIGRLPARPKTTASFILRLLSPAPIK